MRVASDAPHGFISQAAVVDEQQGTDTTTEKESDLEKPQATVAGELGFSAGGLKARASTLSRSTVRTVLGAAVVRDSHQYVTDRMTAPVSGGIA
jgi:hypothetical protein